MFSRHSAIPNINAPRPTMATPTPSKPKIPQQLVDGSHESSGTQGSSGAGGSAGTVGSGGVEGCAGLVGSSTHSGSGGGHVLGLGLGSGLGSGFCFGLSQSLLSGAFGVLLGGVSEIGRASCRD